MKNNWKASASAAAIIVAAGMATTGLSTTAQAGGDFAAPPAPASWSGFYVGAHAGGGKSYWDGAYDANSTSSAVFGDDIDADGILGGIHIGYNWQVNNIVFGVEGDISFMDWDGTAPAVSSSDEITGSIDSLASVRGRLGMVVGAEQKTLLFASLGVAWIDAEATVFPDGRLGDTTNFGFDFDDTGLVVGGGFEYALRESFRLRGDINYYHFDESADLFGAGVTSAIPGDRVELEDVLTVRLGATWYIGKKHREVALK